DAKDACHVVAVKVQESSDVAYDGAMADDPGIAKIIADWHSRLLLGAHIVGHEAAMLIRALTPAMASGQRADKFATGQYWIHPALPEVIENGLLGLEVAD